AYADLTLPFINDFYLTAGLQKHYFGLIYSWDYTHPEKSLADDQGVCASADYGITVNGFLPKGFGELQLGLYNGEGYKYGGRYVNLSPELLANLRLTPITGLTVGVSVFANNADAAQYKNDRKGRDHTGSYFMNADTSNANRLAFAPMFRLVFGPVSLLGEYIGYNYTRRYSYYQLNRDSANNIVDSTLIEENKKYEFSGADLLPVITLLNRKVEIYGRFSLGNRREQKGDSIVVNNDKSFVRYGVGFNYHLVRRAKGKPGLEFQFAWQRTQPNRKETKPSDLFVAQMRFEWNSVIK
ncbi:MAG: hypothetical protein ACUVUR_03885, partial [bacterium]